MNKKYIIGAIVVLVAIVLILSSGNKKAVAPEVPVNPVAEQLVTSPATTPAVTNVPVAKPVVAVPKTVTPSAPAMTKDGSYIVSYTNNGFVPKTLTIMRGKSVHFVNNSNKAMSITTTTTENQVQSELNQSKTVGQGGSYDFTFVTAGTWVYMNRTAQADFASIIVE